MIEMSDSPKLVSLLKPEDVAEILGVTIKALEAQRWRGNGPKYIRFPSRLIRYHPDDVMEWIEANRRVKTTRDQVLIEN